MSGKRSLVYGVGVNDWVGNISVNGKMIWEYTLWKDMLRRSFDEKLKQRQPTYEGVTCSKEMQTAVWSCTTKPKPKSTD